MRDGILTGEGVVLDARPASFVTRALGAVIDLTAIATVLLILLFAAAGSALASVSPEFAPALWVIILMLVMVGIPTTVETLTRGRSLGKLAMGIRVVRDDGGPVRFRHAFIRALVGVGELWLTFGSVALIASLSNDKGKRVGDMLAGTYAIRVRGGRPTYATIVMPPYLAGWAAHTDMRRLPDGLALAVRQFLGRATTLNSASRVRIGQDLAGKIERYVALARRPALRPRTSCARCWPSGAAGTGSRPSGDGSWPASRARCCTGCRTRCPTPELTLPPGPPGRRRAAGPAPRSARRPARAPEHEGRRAEPQGTAGPPVGAPGLGQRRAEPQQHHADHHEHRRQVPQVQGHGPRGDPGHQGRAAPLAQRTTTSRTASATLTWSTAWATTRAVGGPRLEIASPGIPMRLSGYGPTATSPAMAASAATATSARVRRAGRPRGAPGRRTRSPGRRGRPIRAGRWRPPPGPRPRRSAARPRAAGPRRPRQPRAIPTPGRHAAGRRDREEQQVDPEEPQELGRDARHLPHDRLGDPAPISTTTAAAQAATNAATGFQIRGILRRTTSHPAATAFWRGEPGVSGAVGRSACAGSPQLVGRRRPGREEQQRQHLQDPRERPCAAVAQGVPDPEPFAVPGRLRHEPVDAQDGQGREGPDGVDEHVATGGASAARRPDGGAPGRAAVRPCRRPGSGGRTGWSAGRAGRESG
ncbi:RDD family protein [Oerskovia sp. M15]